MIHNNIVTSILFIVLFFCSFSCSNVHSLKDDDLVAAFEHPDISSRPNCFWWWFNSLVNKEGITRDLEKIKDKGMGGVPLACTGNDSHLPLDAKEGQ